MEIAILAFSYYASYLGVLFQWGIALLSLFAVGFAIKSVGNLKGWAFIYLVGSKKGLKFIDTLSRKGRRFWNEMAVWGLVVSFGLLSYPMFRKTISKKQYFFGVVSLAFILFVILPYLLSRFR